MCYVNYKGRPAFQFLQINGTRQVDANMAGTEK